MRPGSRAAYQGVCPPGVSGVGPRPLIGVLRPLGHFGSGAQAAGLLIGARAHPEFQLWAPSPLIWVGSSRASGELRGCFSVFTVQGRRGTRGCGCCGEFSY